jgi:hypothetical protein
MKPWMGMRLLRANAVFLMAFGTLGLVIFDIPGIWFSVGPATSVLGGARQAGIGFVEAHGMAFIIGVLFWRSSRISPQKQWHGIACAVHALLGSANLLFWPVFVDGGVLWLGYVTTLAHLVLASLHSVALAARAPSQIRTQEHSLPM